VPLSTGFFASGAWTWSVKAGREHFPAPGACLYLARCIGSAPLKAPVAQLDRAPDYESGGRGFESCPVHHSCSNTHVRKQGRMLAVYGAFCRDFPIEVGGKGISHKAFLVRSSAPSPFAERPSPVCPKVGVTSLYLHKWQRSRCAHARPVTLTVRSTNAVSTSSGRGTISPPDRAITSFDCAYSEF
jgi:hypothetical protein